MLNDLFVHGSKTRRIAENIAGALLSLLIVAGMVCAYLNRLDPNYCGL